MREQVLRENLESSSEWGRSLLSEDEDESVVHYESDTERTDPESGSSGASVHSEDD